MGSPSAYLCATCLPNILLLIYQICDYIDNPISVPDSTVVALVIRGGHADQHPSPAEIAQRLGNGG